LSEQLEIFHFHGMCGRVAIAALEEAQADYRIHIVDYFSESERQKYYRDVNPSGRFPALRIGSTVLIENPAILLYFNDIFPEARLLPPASDPLHVALHRADVIHCSATLHGILTRVRSPTRIADEAFAQEQVKQKATATLMPHMERIDVRLGEGAGYWYGSWSIMDNYLSWIYWILRGCDVDLSHLRHYSRSFERINERPATQRMLARERSAMVEAGVAVPRL